MRALLMTMRPTALLPSYPSNQGRSQRRPSLALPPIADHQRYLRGGQAILKSCFSTAGHETASHHTTDTEEVMITFGFQGLALADIRRLSKQLVIKTNDRTVRWTLTFTEGNPVSEAVRLGPDGQGTDIIIIQPFFADQVALSGLPTTPAD
jgi:hypothetical protein